MRLFQNCNLYPSYVPRLRRMAGPGAGFEAYRRAMLDDLYAGMHLLQPVIDGDPQAFLANGHDAVSQRAWAAEHGLLRQLSLDDILLAQIEEHRAEVFYNLDPITFPGGFARRLPGCVKLRIAWRAAPSGKTDFSGYDCMVCNFPSILRGFESAGLRTAEFSPSYDDRLAPIAGNVDRPIDIAFVGSFSRHHTRRTELLQVIARMARRHRVELRLETSMLTRLAEWIPLMPANLRRSREVARLAQAPVFGRQLYQLLSQARIVVNGAIDMSGAEKGNIRCFEAMASGALLFSDAGQYPPGMVDGETFVAYAGMDDVESRLDALLAEPARLQHIAQAGHHMLASRYAKRSQWERFTEIVAEATR